MGTGERRSRERAQRKDEIIDAARRLFFSQGYEGTTMVEIAESLELAKGTVYLSFPSKEHLAHEIFLRSFDVLIGLVRNAAAAEEGGVRKLRAMAGAYVEYYREHYEDFFFLQTFEGILYETIGRGDFGSAFRRRFDELTAVVRGAIEAGLADGSLRRDIRPELSSVTYMFAVDGVMRQLITRSRLFQELLGFSEEELIEELFRILIHSLE